VRVPASSPVPVKVRFVKWKSVRNVFEFLSKYELRHEMSKKVILKVLNYLFELARDEDYYVYIRDISDTTLDVNVVSDIDSVAVHLAVKVAEYAEVVREPYRKYLALLEVVSLVHKLDSCVAGTDVYMRLPIRIVATERDAVQVLARAACTAMEWTIRRALHERKVDVKEVVMKAVERGVRKYNEAVYGDKAELRILHMATRFLSR